MYTEKKTVLAYFLMLSLPSIINSLSASVVLSSANTRSSKTEQIQDTIVLLTDILQVVNPDCPHMKVSKMCEDYKHVPN